MIGLLTRKRLSRRRPSPVPDRPLAVACLQDPEELRLYRQALAQSGDAVVIANAQGVIEYVNAAFEQISGYEAAEVIGSRPSLLKSGEHDESFYAQLWTTLRQGRSFRGVLINRHKNGYLFHEEKTISPITDRLGNITHYVSTGRNVNARIATERQLRQLAYYDALTGLPNRKLFMKQLADSTDQGNLGAHSLVLLLDINNLKMINDTLGHSAGDQALRLLANRLAKYCRNRCRAARWGGDEYALVVNNATDDEAAHQVVEGVIELLDHPLELDDQLVFLSASIGVARYPQDGTDPEELMSHADLALHRAKTAGCNEIVFYAAAMRDSLHEDLQIETALHGALEREEFRLVFQPVRHTTDGRIVALEALLRWTSPALGEIATARFIPQLERTGLIVPVGRWVLQQACAEVMALGKLAPTLRVAVNVSARQLLHPGFVADVEAALDSSGLAPARLELEITESVLIENAGAAAAVLDSLRQLGVRIAADDFGTGYSSLSYLWRFPFSTLKIDRAFVAAMGGDPQAGVIVRSILTLAQGLGLEVVAEGIEEAGQFVALKAMGCLLIQGYWSGRPVPIALINAALAQPDHERNEPCR